MDKKEWQTGNDCKLNYQDRIEEMEKWLLDNKKSILSGKTSTENEVIVGFIDL